MSLLFDVEKFYIQSIKCNIILYFLACRHHLRICKIIFIVFWHLRRNSWAASFRQQIERPKCWRFKCWDHELIGASLEGVDHIQQTPAVGGQISDKQRAATERSENTCLYDFKRHYLYCLIGIYPEHDFRLFEDIQTILDIYSNVVGKLMTRRSWRAVLRACAWFRRQLEGWERIEMGCCLDERWRSDQPAHVGLLLMLSIFYMFLQYSGKLLVRAGWCWCYTSVSFVFATTVFVNSTVWSRGNARCDDVSIRYTPIVLFICSGMCLKFVVGSESLEDICEQLWFGRPFQVIS